MFNILKYWKEIILVLAVSLGSYLIYDKIYTSAVENTAEKYDEKFAEYSKTVITRVAELQDTSHVLVIQNDQKAKELQERLNIVLLAVKNKPLYTVKDGKCTPSTDFINSYNSLVNGNAEK